MVYYVLKIVQGFVQTSVTWVYNDMCVQCLYTSAKNPMPSNDPCRIDVPMPRHYCGDSSVTLSSPAQTFLYRTAPTKWREARRLGARLCVESEECYGASCQDLE